jgi:hypothetical protein
MSLSSTTSEEEPPPKKDSSNTSTSSEQAKFVEIDEISNSLLSAVDHCDPIPEQSVRVEGLESEKSEAPQMMVRANENEVSSDTPTLKLTARDQDDFLYSL